MLLEDADSADAAMFALHDFLGHRVGGCLTEDIVAADRVLMLLGGRIEELGLRAAVESRTIVLVGILTRKSRSVQGLIVISLHVEVEQLKIEDVPCARHLLWQVQ